MRYFFLYHFLLVFVSSKSQNLVPNYSFETYTNCPTLYQQINNAQPWQSASGFSADYYNACSTSTNVSIPKNLYNSNFQYTKNGSGYVGINTINGIGNDFKQTISTQLVSNLLNNNYYLCKFYISNVACYPYAHNNIALAFTSTLNFSVTCTCPLNLPMHIYKYGNPVIKDTLNWTEIMGIYKANGTEQYITIGNFKDDANTKIDTTNYGNLGQGAYYMIDDVSVEPICTPFWSYRDTTITIGDSVLIGPSITGLNINWYDATGTFITNAPGIYVKPNAPTFYTASEDFCNGITTHTINVMVTPTSIKEFNELVNSFTIYPNPTQDKIVITSTIFKTDKLEITMVDLLGRKIAITADKKSNCQTINLEGLENGIYFLCLYDKDTLITTKKVIKK